MLSGNDSSRLQGKPLYLTGLTYRPAPLSPGTRAATCKIITRMQQLPPASYIERDFSARPLPATKCGPAADRIFASYSSEPRFSSRYGDLF
jgi:hypothetical protein